MRAQVISGEPNLNLSFETSCTTAFTQPATKSIVLTGNPKGADNIQKIQMLYAMAVHEAGHIRYTGTVGFKRNPSPHDKLLYSIFNILEDGRIENALVNEYPGILPLFRVMNDVYIPDPNEHRDIAIRENIMNFILYYTKHGYVAAGSEDWDNWDKIAAFVRAARVAKGAEEVLDIAAKVKRLLPVKDPDEYIETTQWAEISISGWGSTEGTPGLGDNIEREKEEEKKEEEGSGKSGKEEKGEDEEDGNGGGKPDEKSDDKDSDSGGGISGELQDIVDIVLRGDELQKKMISELGHVVNQASEIKGKNYSKVNIEFPVLSNRARYDERWDKQTSSKLARQLEELEVITQSKLASKRGKLSPNKLWRVVTQGATKVFRKPTIDTGRDVHVLLLLDESGSMGQHDNPKSKISRAQATCITLHEALLRAKIKHSIVGFTSDLGPRSVDLFIYKRFEDRQKRALELSEANGRRNNRDGPAIRVVSTFFPTNAKSKLMFVMSDGQPAASDYGGGLAAEDTAKAITEARQKLGIKVVGLGFNFQHTAEIVGAYNVYVSVSKPADMLRTMIREIKRELR